MVALAMEAGAKRWCGEGPSGIGVTLAKRARVGKRFVRRLSFVIPNLVRDPFLGIARR
jgi:hypothetical protein